MDIVSQVGRQIVGISDQLIKAVLGPVVKIVSGNLVEHQIHILDTGSYQPRKIIEHFFLGGFQDAIQAAKYGERQNDFPVITLFVVTAQKICDLPDKIGSFPEIYHNYIFGSMNL